MRTCKTNLARDPETGRYMSSEIKVRKKICPQCGQKKWRSEFYPSHTHPGWVSTVCIECQRKNYKHAEDHVTIGKDGRLYEHKGRSRSIFWNPTMLKQLKDMYPNTINEEIAEILGVSPRTMSRKAKELGLKKSKDFIQERNRNAVQLAQIKLRKLGYPGRFQKGTTIGKAYWFKPKNKSLTTT